MNDLALIRDAALEAGRMAVTLREQGLSVQRKADGSPVSNGDLAVDAYLKRTLCTARPEYGWLSEETADTPDRLETGRVFMVDPIDGTTAYVKGAPWFVVSIAVVEAGRPISAAIHAPVLDELYEARDGEGALCNGLPIRAAATSTLDDCAMLGDAALLRHRRWSPPWPTMRVEQRNAIAYRMALVGAGRFDAAVSMGLKHDWDLAAGDLIAREAGACVTDAKGRRLRFNTPGAVNDGLICAAAALQPLILHRTAPIEPTPTPTSPRA